MTLAKIFSVATYHPLISLAWEVCYLPILVACLYDVTVWVQVSSKIRWVEEFENLIVLRTFSKSAGLAGIRVGYGGFPRGLISYLWRAKQPYNVSAAAETAACAALSNKAYLQVCSQPSTQGVPHCACTHAYLISRSSVWMQSCKRLFWTA